MAAVTGTTLATLGALSQAGGAAGSFAQAQKQKKAEEQAQQSATKAIEAAKRKINVNYFDQLALPTEAYDLERDALLSQAATATQAAREGDQRGVAASVGRVQQGVDQGMQGIRTDMADRLLGLDKLSAAEDARIAGQLAQLDEAQARGAQIAAAQAAEQAGSAMTSGFQSLGAAGQQGLQMLPLYAFQNPTPEMSALSSKKPIDSFSTTPMAAPPLPNVGPMYIPGGYGGFQTNAINPNAVLG